MSIVHIELLITSIIIFLSACIYIYPLNHRNKSNVRISLILIITLITIISTALFLQHSLISSYVKLSLRLLFLTVMIYKIVDSNIQAAFYISIWSIITTQFFYSIWFVLINTFNHIFQASIYQLITLLIFYGIYLFGMYHLLAKEMPSNGYYHIGPRQLSSAIGLMIVIEVLYNTILFSDPNRAPQELWSLILAQFYCVTMLFLQTELFKKSAVEKDLLTMNLLWKQKKYQYSVAKENTDLINQKYHDLKHQLLAIRNIVDDDEKKEILDDVEKSIKTYDSIVKTGNEILDTILTDKSFICEKNDITINCIVDGKQLSFMNTTDIYTIFGNAIDNAIESVSKIEDPIKRLIDINVYSKKNFLVMIFSNPILSKINFEAGLPVSTKPDDGYHGYGLKSVRHTIKKYGGFMNLDVENDSFVLKMMIPLGGK